MSGKVAAGAQHLSGCFAKGVALQGETEAQPHDQTGHTSPLPACSAVTEHNTGGQQQEGISSEKHSRAAARTLPMTQTNSSAPAS